MPIEMRCTGCGQTLRVGQEHAGKRARCPTCGTIMAVPSPDAVAPAIPPSTPPTPYPFAAAPEPAAVDTATALAGQPDVTPNPYAPPNFLSGAYVQPHRGGVVLAVGILGLCFVLLTFCCLPLGLGALPLGIAAWVLGAADLKKMDLGSMDPSGRSLTRTGMVLGIVTDVLIVVWVLFLVTAVVLGQMPS